MITTRRSRMATKIGAGVTGLGLAAVAVLGFSNAAFHAETDNSDNNWATSGFVTLESEFTAPLFSVGLNGAAEPYTGTYDSELVVGEGIADREIDIEFGGKADADIRLFLDPAYVATLGLDADTTVTVLRDGSPVYTDVALNALPTDYASASASTWQVGPAVATATYTFSIDTAADAQSGATIEDVQFVWEAQQAA